MTDSTPPWFDELRGEVRRAGRAAVAARAAAEACEESVERLERFSGPSDESRRIVQAILPVCDSLGRMVGASNREGERPRTWRDRLRAARQMPGELRALRQAIRLLDAQLTSALEGLGVRIDREVGGPVDPERHRVMETRAPRDAEAKGMVASVIRPGYRLGGTRIRDADVVATR